MVFRLCIPDAHGFASLRAAVYIHRMLEKRRIAPAVLLFFLSPGVAELLTSSSPPVSFFTPFGLTVMCALYGSGAIVARELAVRWGRGLPSLIALGAAYGILEEGLMVKSFFDPGWPGIGLLGSYGRLAGVNWVWSIELTIFHSLFSIVIPNILVELLFPRSSGKRITGPIGFAALCTVLLADVAFGGLALTKYAPPLVPYVAAGVVAAGLVVLARFLPGRLFPHEPAAAATARRASAPVPYFLLGLGATVCFFLLNWVVPGLAVPPLVTILMVLDVTCGLFVGAWQLGRLYPLEGINRWALASGSLAFFILLAPLVQMDRARTNVQGMAIVGAAMAAFLALVAVRLWRLRRARYG
jgi:hypothetical protein